MGLLKLRNNQNIDHELSTLQSSTIILDHTLKKEMYQSRQSTPQNNWQTYSQKHFLNLNLNISDTSLWDGKPRTTFVDLISGSVKIHIIIYARCAQTCAHANEDRERMRTVT